jgi:hypothetical protein
MLVARTRALKELPWSTRRNASRVEQIIRRYPGWAGVHSPGYVNGMQRKHQAQHGSWADDARHFWQALGRLLGDEAEQRVPAAPKKKPKLERAGEEEVIDPAWPLFNNVRGSRAIIVGGDPREPNRERLERAFQLGSLEWPSIDGPRKVDAVVERIHSGAYDLVIVLQPYVAHREAEPIHAAAKITSTPWALAAGYGVTAVRLALERFLGGPRG